MTTFRIMSYDNGTIAWDGNAIQGHLIGTFIYPELSHESTIVVQLKTLVWDISGRAKISVIILGYLNM